MMNSRKKTARDLMWENGGPGVWAPDYRELYELKDEEWEFNAIPEIMNGRKIADYVDPDLHRLVQASLSSLVPVG
jgi:nucleolar GTP-binding protein